MKATWQLDTNSFVFFLKSLDKTFVTQFMSGCEMQREQSKSSWLAGYGYQQPIIQPIIPVFLSRLDPHEPTILHNSKLLGQCPTVISTLFALFCSLFPMYCLCIISDSYHHAYGSHCSIMNVTVRHWSLLLSLLLFDLGQLFDTCSKRILNFRISYTD